MFFKQIMMDESGALSYFIGCPKGGKACIVNPRKDVHEYIETASRYGMQITEIFETSGHRERHSGKEKLATLTGAQIYFLEKDEKTCGKLAVEGATFSYGEAEVKILSNSQYTPFSNAILVTDKANQNKPWLILTRRCLYADNMDAENLSGKKLADKLTDYLDFYETEPQTGLTDNMATLSRNMFQTSRTELAKMSLPY
ncbi:MAG: hypothetical protein SWH68_01235 [Thermodesulfobacteriota bacterium]|nr:hypothetical protein [Thermodesulfobacteriota bacterium]